MITVDNKYFSVPQICGSGQCFRLDQTGDGNYEVIASDRWLDAFPVDTHIKKVVDLQYGGSFPFDRYKGCAGIMQQYIFYYDLKGGADL